MGAALILRRIAGRLKRRIVSRLGPARSIHYPYVVSLTELIEDGCKFEITTEIETYRVEAYGGEKGFTALVLEALQSSSVLYDLGANVGLVTVHAARKCARVIAFEPDPDYRARLKRNLQLNDLANVQVIDWAVSDKQGEAMLFTDNDRGLATFSPMLTDWPGREATKPVHTDNIDNALERKIIPWPDVLKIDIEGAEMEIGRAHV
jgi:FkbM family methyltransferase